MKSRSQELNKIILIPKSFGIFNYLITNPQRSDTLVMAYKYDMIKR